MTSVLQRPRSTQTMNDFGTHSGDDDLYRASGHSGGVPRMAGLTDNTASTSTLSGNVGAHSISSPPALGMLGHEGGFDGTFQGVLADPSSSSTTTTSSTYNPLLASRDGQPTSLGDSNAASGIFDDPAILALVGDQPFDPRIDFELDLQNEALAAVQHALTQPQAQESQPQSQHQPPSHSLSDLQLPPSGNATSSVTTSNHRNATGSVGSKPKSDPSSSSSTSAVTHAAQSRSSTNPQYATYPASSALAEIDLTSVGGILQFPEMPASLLDQAPEYEYSLHTQANVFDAVQDYQGAGEDEAARIFGLDNYDPSLAMGHSAGESAGQSVLLQGDNSGGERQEEEDVWRYHQHSAMSGPSGADPSTGSSFGHHGHYSGDGFTSSFPDTSSMISSSEYPLEPSSAPTSHGSEWNKVEAVTAAAAAAAAALGMERGGAGGYAELTPPSAKRRRELSFDPRPVESQNHSFMPPPPHHPSFEAGNNIMYANANMSAADNRGADNRTANREPMVPSQGLTLQPSQQPQQPQQQQRGRMTSWNGSSLGDSSHHRLSADGWQNSAPSSSVYDTGIPSFGPSHFAVGATTNGSNGNAHSVPMNEQHAAANSSMARTDMINAIGNAMDASMESDGVAKCPYPNCSKTFAKNRSYNLKAHLRSHSQLKPFQCIHCPRAFSRKHDLERHTRVHSGDKPYLCEACGKGFPRSDALRRHWRVEKECGDKAVEIEAKQPLPSLPPGVNTPAAQAKGPIPGLMHFGAPTTTAAAGGMGMLPPGVNPFVPVHSSHHSMMNGVPAPPGWDSAMPNNAIPYGGLAGGMYHPSAAMDRKRGRDEM